jgi:DNA-cytosine methyltransferase
MNVLSLFDGISCGQQALERCGFKVDNYFASEIDKYAIKVTMANYPDTIQLGNVVDIDGYKLPNIDLLMGGSPCQSFSFAGKRKGMSTKDEQEILTLDHYLQLKSEDFEFEGQSYLFWEYMRILNEVKPKYFLLENVEMGEKWERILSKAIGVNGIHINSSLVSAQNRKRIYWTNIGMQPKGLFGYLESIIEQPKDRGILLKDVLETRVQEKYFLSEKFDNWLNKHSLKTRNEYKKTEGNRKAGCLSVSALKSVNLSADFILDNNIPKNRKIIQHNIPEIVSVRKYELDIPKFQYTLKQHRWGSNKDVADALQVPKTMVDHWFRIDNYFSIPDRNIWFKLKELLKIETDEFDQAIIEFEERESVFDKTNRVYDEEGIAPTLTSTSADERILVRNDGIYNNQRLNETIEKHNNNIKHGTLIDSYNKQIHTNKSITIAARINDGNTHIVDNKSIDIKKVKQVKQINSSLESGGKQPYQQNRVYDVDGISPALMKGKSDLLITSLNENQEKKFNPNINADKANTLTLAQGRAGSSDEYMDAVSKIAKLTSRIRRLTPIECERLQTVKDNYTNHVSDSQRYKMLGNGWTIDVICHILNYIKNGKSKND